MKNEHTGLPGAQSKRNIKKRPIAGNGNSLKTIKTSQVTYYNAALSSNLEHDLNKVKITRLAIYCPLISER
jgi:hypothetical protein